MQQTPVYGFPYPLDNDPVYQGAAHIRNIAQRLEDTLKTTGPAPAGTDVHSISERLLALENALADTGWRDLVLEPGFRWYNSYPGKIRRIGQVVYIIGALDISAGPWNEDGPFLSIPEGFRPGPDVPAPIYRRTSASDPSPTPTWIDSSAAKIFHGKTSKTSGRFDIGVIYHAAPDQTIPPTL